MAATLENIAEGQWQLSGDLDFASVPVIWRKLRRAMAKEKQFSLSLQQVVNANSAALVMLLEAKQEADAAGTVFRVQHMPATLMALFSLSNAEHLIADVLI